MSQALVASVLTEQVRGALPNTPQLKAPRSQRQPELDALRGLMLLLMTLAHLPTHFQVVTNQQLGFVSEAEGFVFLSAFLTGRIFGRIANESGFPTVIRRLWTRALRLYGYHLVLLAIAFTVVAAAAIHTQRPSLQGLLDFYLAHPHHAVKSALLLVYCPPLLDILPMYIIFLVATPVALYVASRWSWKLVLIPSGLIWVLAQFGLRAAIHAHLVQSAGLQIPLNEMGAFDLLAWQFLWAVGLWIGAGSPANVFQVLTSKRSVFVALSVAAGVFLVRHPLLHLQFNGALWSGLIDKWHLGGLRLLDFSSLAILFAVSRSWLARWLTISPLVSLGKASLEVFCAHLLFCFAAISLVGRGTHLPAWLQLALIAASLIGLYAVARLSVRTPALPGGPTRLPAR
ncbi:MAG: OpgC protein [Candidatus Acidoferrum typicum]|nr:OpgC protein [Candidatus Acidoferrum typicum]